MSQVRLLYFSPYVSAPAQSVSRVWMLSTEIINLPTETAPIVFRANILSLIYSFSDSRTIFM